MRTGTPSRRVRTVRCLPPGEGRRERARGGTTEGGNGMAKYLLLYEGGSMPESEMEQAAVMQAWEQWFTQLGAAVTDPGNPFTPASARVSADGSIGAGASSGGGHPIPA